MNIFIALVLILFPLVTIILKRRKLPPQQRIPPGSLGLPLIGQSLGLLQAMRANTAEKWLEDRVKKYGPISKLSLFGKPTVFVYGQDANKLVFASSNSNTMTNHQTQSVRMILGDRCLLELNGEDHKRVRGALASFLKPESLKMYVGKIEEEVQTHIQMYWQGKQQVTVLPLMKNLTFNIICSLLFGIESRERRNEYVQQFQEMIQGMWSIPVNLPFTRFNRSLKASAKVQKLLKDLLQEKRQELLKGAPSNQDLISCLLSIHGEESQDSVSEDEIIHNVMLIMAAGHDTSSVLITFILRVLANNPTVYEAVLKGELKFRMAPHDFFTCSVLILLPNNRTR
ncbi:OLC1v1022749C1 [Oldenlandia corymbosa var. corymbosa]|uniref:OLC1v1022749C1 n=1 Tax=Oldenlandia corymbosa var. corymbosa TaxID=529605 RepID=A0AAV1BYI2_OLDCO|nr:OLC1v1022749C1 [Oldenlandia corymbosa var. corymbosa]